MGLPTVNVTPGAGITANTLQDGGRHAAADSHPFVASIEDFAVLTAIRDTLATQATLAAVLAKLSDNPATAAGVAAVVTRLNSGIGLDATTLAALENITVTVANPTAAGLTDAQLRATPVAVTGTFTPAAGGATAANQTSELAKLDQLHADLTQAAPANLPPKAKLTAGVDRSGVTVAGAADVAAANANRLELILQNTSDAEMRVTENGVTATATTGFKLLAGLTVKVSTSNRISVYCATAGKTFAATEV